MIAVGERYTVKIEDTNVFAKGICHIENMVVFVSGAITGEKCNVEITKVYPKYAYAKAIELFEKSSHRIVPSCPCFQEWGGCSFSHISMEMENEIKHNYVLSSFKKAHLDAEIAKTVCPVSLNYRNKIVLFYDRGSFGYMKEGTNKIVPHSSCVLNEDMFDQIAEYTKEALKGTELRALYLRKSSHSVPEILVCPIFYKKTNIISYATSIVNAFPNIRTVMCGTLGDKDFILEKVKFSTVYGDGYINDTLCGLSFRISPESFYQINHAAAQLLYEKAIELADLDENTLCADLFCGTGTIGIIAAHKTGATVYGVEIVEKAVKDAIYNAKTNNVKNAHFKAMDAGKFDKEVDVCIIDPPRKGCSPFMLDTLKRLKPRKIVYVSCNTDTMTRDLKSLAEEYKISSPVSIFNLFPRTTHVESVVCLTRRLDN